MHFQECDINVTAGFLSERLKLSDNFPFKVTCHSSCAVFAAPLVIKYSTEGVPQ